MNTSTKNFVCDCGGEMEIKKISKKIPIGKQEIFLDDVDAKICLKCGEIYFDGEMILALEAEIKKNTRQAA
ncbi:MAG TPA: YgiT-type zinc finger protein [Pyrinomonadaceae bacterium]|nr:YgiT-type zinc finger protein [Pyrinomonadaceae bacterium]